MDDRAELIERLEKLSGPDREVDASTARAFGWFHVTFPCTNINGSTERGNLWFPPGTPENMRESLIESYRDQVRDNHWPSDNGLPRLTASLDAAVALVEKVKPGWKKQILEGRSGNWIARVSSPRYETSSTDYMREREPDGSPNGAIALLIALLRSDKEAG